MVLAMQRAPPGTAGSACNFAVSQDTWWLLGMATQGSSGFQGVFFFIILCIYYLKDTWSASKSLLSSPQGGFVIEYIDFGRVASNDPLLLLLICPCPPPPFFFSTTTSLIIKKKENRGSHFRNILPSEFFRALLATACGLICHIRDPFSVWQQL